MKPRALYPTLFAVSAVGIAYQVTLMRVFTIGQWHHFAYMVIGIAMLGFGASGTLVSLLRKRIDGHEAGLFSGTVLLLPVMLAGCYALSQRVPFETFQLVTQRVQLGHLFLLYLILGAPFFVVSTCIMLSFMLRPEETGKLYFVNMTGSGLGAAGIIGLLFLIHPQTLPYVLALSIAVVYLIFVSRSVLSRIGGAAVLLVLAGLLAGGAVQPIRVSEYKGLSYAQQLPDFEIIARAKGPMSVIDAVSSSMIRETPGQISNYPMSELGVLPEQIALFFDAGGASPVHRFDGSFAPFAYLDYVTSAVAYRVAPARPEVLVIGAGGGTDVIAALSQGAAHVTAVEVDPNVFGLVRGPLGAFSGGLYERDDVTPVVAEGRGFLESQPKQYDLIQIALLDSFTATAAGVHALNESYLYTIEAIERYLDRLTPGGVLAMTRWLKTPPRDALKLFATTVEACERAGFETPGDHLVFIRSWNTGTILVTKEPLTPDAVAAVRQFCEDRWFDLGHLPGIDAAETNRFIVLQEPVYYTFSQAMLGPDREKMYRDAVFHVRPATDDQPYFFRFFKWGSITRLTGAMGADWIPFVEWGYVALVVTLIQAVAASVLLILLPLLALSRTAGTRNAKRWVLLYFTGLGAAYMFLEIAFIQRFMLFLAYPIYAVTVVLASFLIFSGLGSLFAHYRLTGGRAEAARHPLVGGAVAGIAVVALIYLLALPSLFSAWAGWSDPAKIAVSLVLLAPMAFLMGIPFPVGLHLIVHRFPALLPWAWGMNGCASVVGATLATLIAVHLGFRVLVLISVVVYILTWLGLQRLETATD